VGLLVVREQGRLGAGRGERAEARGDGSRVRADEAGRVVGRHAPRPPSRLRAGLQRLVHHRGQGQPQQLELRVPHDGPLALPPTGPAPRLLGQRVAEGDQRLRQRGARRIARDGARRETERGGVALVLLPQPPAHRQEGGEERGHRLLVLGLRRPLRADGEAEQRHQR